MKSASSFGRGLLALSCTVEFTYRGDEVAAQAASGAVRYDISCDPASGRWYLDASWTAARAPAPCLAVSGIPTARFRDRLVQMAANAGLPVIVADPAYTSRWGS